MLLWSGKRVNSSPLVPGVREVPRSPGETGRRSLHTQPLHRAARLCMAITSPPSGGRSSCCLSRCFSASREEVRGRQGDAMNYLSWPRRLPGPWPSPPSSPGRWLVRPQEGEGRTGWGQRDLRLEAGGAGAIFSSQPSWRFRAATFPARVTGAQPLPTGLLFATGPWAASLQPGQLLPGHLEETSEHREP